MKSACNILFIEGIPGSGKTTLAKNVHTRCEASGMDSFWVKEEDKDHPVIPAGLRRLSNTPDFTDRCILSWKNFAKNLRKTAILEGCAFQSTIRFMFANDASKESIRYYTALWEETVAPAKVKMVLLVTSPPFDDYFQRMGRIRGENWMLKVSEYVSCTPHGKRHHLKGLEGMACFWSRYQDLCVDLVKRLETPSFIADISGKQWDGLDKKVFNWAFL